MRPGPCSGVENAPSPQPDECDDERCDHGVNNPIGHGQAAVAADINQGKVHVLSDTFCPRNVPVTSEAGKTFNLAKFGR